MTYVSLNSKEKGALGEEIASIFLMRKGFTVVERNYLKKWGEIDIVAQKEGRIHFVEVKSILTKGDRKSVFHPEENVHILKQRRLRRAIQTYLLERKHGLDAEFFFHIVVVRMNTETHRAKVSMLENVIL